MEDRFGLISSKVPRLFKPQVIIKNFAREAVEFLKRCENPRNFPLPPAEPEVPRIEGYTLNVFFRLFYTDADLSKTYRIGDYKRMESPAVDFEMKFLAGRVPFADLSVVYIYELEPLEGQ